jgi:hypothetical protein
LLFLFFMVLVPAILALLLWGFSIITPQTYARQVIMMLPFYYLVLAAGLSKVGKFFWPILLGVILLNGVAAYNYYIEDVHREDWKGAVAQINGNGVVIFVPDSYAHNFRYAYKGNLTVYGGFTRKSIAIGEFSQLEALQAIANANIKEMDVCRFLPLTTNAERVWFVQTNGPDGDAFASWRLCLEKNFVLDASWKSEVYDMWGTADVDVEVFTYRRTAY